MIAGSVHCPKKRQLLEGEKGTWMSDSRICTVIHSPGKVVIDPYEVCRNTPWLIFLFSCSLIHICFHSYKEQGMLWQRFMIAENEAKIFFLTINQLLHSHRPDCFPVAITIFALLAWCQKQYAYTEDAAVTDSNECLLQLRTIVVIKHTPLCCANERAEGMSTWARQSSSWLALRWLFVHIASCMC